MLSVYQAKDHKWRDSYNPLRGLTMLRLTSMLDAGERGQYADLQWFYHFMESSDAMITSVIQRRKSALLSVDWDIRTAANTTDPILAEEQRAFLREAYDGIENFKDAVGFLWGATMRGYSHLEKNFGPSGLIERLEPVEQWFWVREGMFGEWEYNRDATTGAMRGEAITRENFVIYETIALNRILSVLYLRKNISQKDWDSYLAVYGIPSVFLVGPPNASAEREKEFQEIANVLIADGRGYLPSGSDIKYVNGGGTGQTPFIQLIEYLDKQITITATGGILTMLAESGSGTLAGNAHNETFMQIARSDAVTLSGVLQKDIDIPLLEEFFPGWPALAYFEFAPVASDQTRQVVEDAANLSKAGIKVNTQELAEKTGLKLEDDPQAAAQ